MTFLQNLKISKAVRTRVLVPSADESPVVFSEGFETKMGALIRADRRKSRVGAALRGAGGVAVAAAVALTVLSGMNWDGLWGGIALSPGPDTEPVEAADPLDIADPFDILHEPLDDLLAQQSNPDQPVVTMFIDTWAETQDEVPFALVMPSHDMLYIGESIHENQNLNDNIRMQKLMLEPNIINITINGVTYDRPDCGYRFCTVRASYNDGMLLFIQNYDPLISELELPFDKVGEAIYGDGHTGYLLVREEGERRATFIIWQVGSTQYQITSFEALDFDVLIAIAESLVPAE